MPSIAVLKKMYDLKSVHNMGLKLLKKFKNIRISPRSELGSVKSLVRTEDLTDDERKRYFTSITGDDAAQILELAAAPVNGENLKKVLHVTVIPSTEIVQPAGEDLRHVDNEKKKKNYDLVQRVPDLEESKEGNIKELKDKVRSLALQANSSEPLILLSLDELAKKTRRQNDDDVETFDESARQTQRH
ncbi:unnamed protein product [Mytilus coruscus]|uniref:Uncharacterized protein n=1 Tax=Mytilus coruscus TaxID=42192 RepID=A0A6J8BZR6_MYTCO|nr:unnamed protein product [Mytilus coruscus]